ncbi:CHRD domain-containing protein [Sunxiuqinia dokdonensis]|uniref:CHRD domain-containing protein n=1 Tax=Sunxiuqinia dokdonensis TaxID=1409788 RepID=A0A0L8V4J5_9BACT|nr:CHRD domain-containing protein [Sunxiuqinia dokdonensis]KOH43356.1 hypothetical protein NC99_37830 [Sunxiuqinia dokdonensis]
MKTINDLFKEKVSWTAVLVILFFVGMTSCGDDSDPEEMVDMKVNYSADFVKANDEVTTSATGSATATYDPATMELSYSATWSGLGSNAVNMHFHNDGPVMVGIPGFPEATGGTVSGTISLTSQQASDLAAGKIYMMIHTVDYPGGEVNATLTKSSSSSNNTGENGSGY